MINKIQIFALILVIFSIGFYFGQCFDSKWTEQNQAELKLTREMLDEKEKTSMRNSELIADQASENYMWKTNFHGCMEKLNGTRKNILWHKTVTEYDNQKR
jgi:hypothetical protein